MSSKKSWKMCLNQKTLFVVRVNKPRPPTLLATFGEFMERDFKFNSLMDLQVTNLRHRHNQSKDNRFNYN